MVQKENTKLSEFEKSSVTKQRIGIASALYQKPKNTLLDEPTSALDEENEIEIFEYLKNLKKDMIIVMATHKIKAKDYSDKSYNIKDNNIVEFKLYEKNKVLGIILGRRNWSGDYIQCLQLVLNIFYLFKTS